METDCTTALQLDNTYVKAYQRRAAARVKLDQLEEAKTDLEQVLKYEPKNQESKAALSRVEEDLLKKQPNEIEQKTTKPVSKFTQSRQNKKITVLKSESDKSNFNLNKAVVVERKETSKAFVWPQNDNLEIVDAISKPPHLRSKVPLKRIAIEIKPPPVQIKTEKVEIERRENKKKSVSFAENAVKTEKSQIRIEEPIKQFIEPITSIQFFAQWKQFSDDVDLKYEYLKVMNPKNLKEVFKESLDSKTFSDILKVLSKHSGDHNVVYHFLKGLTEVKRFCTLVFFMTKADKDGKFFIYKKYGFYKVFNFRCKNYN